MPKLSLALLVVASFLPAFAPERLRPVSPQRSSPEGLLLLHKMQDALGGAKRIAAVHDLPVKTAGVSVADPDRPVPAEMRYEEWRELSAFAFLHTESTITAV